MKRDEFEAREMHDGHPVVHRDKSISRKMAAILAVPGFVNLALAVFIAFANASSDKPLPASALPFVVAALAALGLFFFGMGIAFAVLRTVVTSDAVHVKYGLWGPSIPLDAITSCRVTEYDWTEFGGWGIRHGKAGARAYVPASGPVVEIVYDDGGTSKRVLVGAENAALTAEAIERARAARSGGVRIANAAEARALAAARGAEDEGVDEALEEDHPARRNAR